MRALASEISGKLVKLLFLTVTALVLAGTATAQTQVAAADLSGTVTDPTGAVVAGAVVHAKNSATGLNRTVTADSEGNYLFIGLPPGDYEITAEAPTFKKVVISPVKLTVGQNAALTIKLEVGEATAIVNVTGDDIQLV